MTSQPSALCVALDDLNGARRLSGVRLEIPGPGSGRRSSQARWSRRSTGAQAPRVAENTARVGARQPIARGQHRSRRCGAGSDGEGMARCASLEARRGQVRYLAAPGSIESMLRSIASSGLDDIRAPKPNRSRPLPRPGSSRGGYRPAGGQRFTGPPRTTEGSNRALPLSGAEQSGGCGIDGGKRRRVGKPPVSRSASAENGVGWSFP